MGGVRISDLKPVFKRVLLKLSGEALAGGKKTGLDFGVIQDVCNAIKKCVSMGVEVGIVVGGGNFWRGALDGGGKMERSRADHMGMMATVMNCLALQDVFEQIGVAAKVQTALDIQAVAESYSRQSADYHLKNGCVVIFGCGTGSPFFSTDTASALRAAEIGAEIILLAKNIDGVYTADPKLDSSAKKLKSISYAEVLAERLKVMDATATSLAMDNNIPVMIFALSDPTNIIRAVCGEDIGTKVG